MRDARVGYADVMRRAFTLIEIIGVITVSGVVAAAGLFAAGNLVERARRDDQARAAVAQIRKLRADALASQQGAAVEVTPSPGGGVRVITATVPRSPGLAQCDAYRGRATSVVERDYDLLAITVPRPAELCFDADAFRLLAPDGVTLAPVPASIAIAAEGGAPLGELTVAPLGTFTSTVVASGPPGAPEGLSATVNVTPPPLPEDPVQHVVEPRVLVPELPVLPPAPPDPVTPAGEPVIEALPPPAGAPPPPPPPACVVTPDCSPGFSCIANECIEDPPGCTSDSDCPDVQFGCDIGSGTCSQNCNTFLCPWTGTCGGCRSNECCTAYSCLCV